jgi:hypothetical protein
MLMTHTRRSERMLGNSDPVDALAVARAALRERAICRPRSWSQRSALSNTAI